MDTSHSQSMAVTAVQPIEHTIKFGNGLVDAAKSIEIETGKFLNLDTSQYVIRYRRMAPIVIARRLRATFNKNRNEKLPAFIAEFEAAQEFNVTEGKAELIDWASTQSNGTVSISLYNWIVDLNSDLSSLLRFD